MLPLFGNCNDRQRAPFRNASGFERHWFRPDAPAVLPMGRRRFAWLDLCYKSEPMRMLPHPTVERRLSDWPLAVKSILGLWFFYYLTVVARAYLTNDPYTLMFNRSLTTGMGIALSACIYLVFAMFARQGS